MSFRGPSEEAESLTFPQVFPKELEEIVKARTRRARRSADAPEALQDDLVGLAFSGGGIRSATFNLGLIQAFARHHLLASIDYLSTVSGGGYIGSWLTSWAYHISRDHPGENNQIAFIERELNRMPAHVGDVSEPAEVHFLRKYSNYLTPRLGILSADTLAFLATYLRNLILNQMILVSALLSLLLVPRVFAVLLYALAKRFEGSADPTVFESEVFWGGFVAIILLFISAIGILNNLRPDNDKVYPSKLVVGGIAIPLLLSGFAFSYVLWLLVHSPKFCVAISSYSGKAWFVSIIAILYLLLWGGAAYFAPGSLETSGYYLRLAPALWAIPTGFGAGFVLLVAGRLMMLWTAETPVSAYRMVTFGVPAVCVLFLFIGVIHLGLIGRLFEDGVREWWARLGGILLALTILWFLLCLLTLFVPHVIREFWLTMLNPDKHLSAWAKKVLSGLGLGGGVGGWLWATVKGVIAARRGQVGPGGSGTDQSSSRTNRRARLLAQIAPPVFSLGLMIYLAVILELFVPKNRAGSEPHALLKVFAIWVGLFLFSLLIGFRVDVNEFSLHNAYRNRLIRCYLGATNEGREPQPFTGFDEQDNVYMHDLLGLGTPFHIVNATLNVVKGKELALQARKARSFVFTPLYSGFDYIEDPSVAEMPGSLAVTDIRPESTSDSHLFRYGSFRLTKNCSLRSKYPGARLGTAMAISGAAASPNMGRYTTGAIGFLLTVCSVRLGWWLGNPRYKKAWESGHPRSSWLALLRELTGSTNDDAREVYLSDGGHFENLGVYELVRRRCRVIIASDAGADPAYACTDLASAIEKCRVDFATHIQIDVDCLKPTAPWVQGTGANSGPQPFVVGTITYPDGREGTLIYIKPSLKVPIPLDVRAYSGMATDFPQQSTLEQWFDESQFESYRALGFACGSAAVGTIKDAIQPATTAPH
jgi:hypothetical protein